MPISFDNVAVFSAGGALGYFARAFIDHRLAKSRTNEDRKIKDFNEAARTFKNRIRTELEGIYQAKSSWGGEALSTIKEKTIRIRRYADTFAESLEGSSRRDFNAATEAYCKYCESITYDMCVQLNSHPVSSPMAPKVRDARLNFDKHVDNLLSFAKER